MRSGETAKNHVRSNSFDSSDQDQMMDTSESEGDLEFDTEEISDDGDGDDFLKDIHLPAVIKKHLAETYQISFSGRESQENLNSEFKKTAKEQGEKYEAPRIVKQFIGNLQTPFSNSIIASTPMDHVTALNRVKQMVTNIDSNKQPMMNGRQLLNQSDDDLSPSVGRKSGLKTIESSGLSSPFMGDTSDSGRRELENLLEEKEKELAEVRKINSELEEEIASLNSTGGERERLKKEIDSLERDLTESRGKTADKEKVIETMRSKQQELTTEKLGLQRELETLSSSLNDEGNLMKECDKLKEENKRLVEEIGEITKENAAIKKENSDIKKESAEMRMEKKDLRMEKEDLKREKEGLKKDLEDLKNDLKDLQTQNDDLKKEVKDLRLQNDDLKKSNKNLLDSKSRLEIEVEQSAKVSAKLTSQVANMAEQLAGLEKTNASVCEEVEKLETMVTDLKTSSENLRLELKDSNQTVSLLTAEKESLEKRVVNVGTEKEGLEEKLTRVETEKSHLDSEYNQSKTESEKIQEELSSLIEEKQQLDTMVEKLKSENELWEKKFGRKEDRIEAGMLRNYKLLDLDHVDTLTFADLSNNLKNILDLFEIRYHNMKPYFQFVRYSFDFYEQFCASLHRMLYDGAAMSTKLSVAHNLRHFEPDNVRKLKLCLQGMLNRVSELSQEGPFRRLISP